MNRRGSTEILIALAIIALAGVMLSTSQVLIKSRSEGVRRRFETMESSMAAEVASVNAYVREKSFSPPAGTPDGGGAYNSAFPIQYDLGLPGSLAATAYSSAGGYSGESLNVRTTANFDSSHAPFRQIASDSVRYLPASANGLCGKFCPTGASCSRGFQKCIADNSPGPGAPATADLKISGQDSLATLNDGDNSLLVWNSTNTSNCKVYENSTFLGPTQLASAGYNAGVKHGPLDLLYTLRCQIGGNRHLVDRVAVRVLGPSSHTVVVSIAGIAWGDEGAQVSLDLATGEWTNLAVYNPDYDSTICQDAIKMDAGSTVTYDGTARANTGITSLFKFNPSCPDHAVGPQITSNPSGDWFSGMPIENFTASFTNDGGGGDADGWVTATLSGTVVTFRMYHSLNFSGSLVFQTH